MSMVRGAAMGTAPIKGHEMRSLSIAECYHVAGGGQDDEAIVMDDVIVTGRPRAENHFEVTVHVGFFGIGPTFGYAHGSNGGDYFFTGIGFGTTSVWGSFEDHESGDARPNGESTTSIEGAIGPGGVSGSVGVWTDFGQTVQDRIQIYSDHGMPGYIPQPGDANYQPR